MRYLILLLGLIAACALPRALSAQETPMISQLITTPLRFEDTNGVLTVSWSQEAVKYSLQRFEALSIRNMSLSDADLRIDYAPTYPEPDLSYQLSVALEAADGTLIYAGPKELVEGRQTESGKKETRYVIWKDLVEKQVDLGTPYTLILRVDILGRLCAEEPTFNVAKKLPYYGGAVVGIGLIGVGQIYRQQANKGETDYQNIWEAGGTASLDQAKKDFDTYRNLTYAGVGVLVLDGVLYLLRTSKFRKAKKRFQTFCVPKTEIAIHPTYNSSTDLGFKLSVKF